jgi:tRNA pseudouridine13 synthase
MFVVEDPGREHERLARRDIHPTGPIHGPKMRPATGEALELEARARSELGMNDEAFAVMAKFAPGSRRDLLVYPGDLRIASPGPGRLLLEFSLPAGSYATVLVREFTRASFFDRSARSLDG